MTNLPSPTGRFCVLTALGLTIGTLLATTGAAGDPREDPGGAGKLASEKDAADQARPQTSAKTPKTLRGTIVGPDGKPVPRTRAYGIKGEGPDLPPLKTSEFTFTHAKPGEIDTLVFVNEVKQLGAAIGVKGDETEPLRVRLEPTVSVKGRLVTRGTARANVEMHIVSLRPSVDGPKAGAPHHELIYTDGDGRFQIDALVPGIEYRLEVIHNGGRNASNNFVSFPWWKVKRGEWVDDWGDVTERQIGNDHSRFDDEF